MTRLGVVLVVASGVGAEEEGMHVVGVEMQENESGESEDENQDENQDGETRFGRVQPAMAMRAPAWATASRWTHDRETCRGRVPGETAISTRPWQEKRVERE